MPAEATAIACEREFREIVGDEYVSVDPAERERLSVDLSLLPFQPAAIVVRPGSLEEVASVVAAADRAKLPLIPRGAGMSYTQAHTPTRPGIVLLDMRRMNRVLHMNAEDLFVVVEAGCTWETLYLALREHDVRTPYWGPLSGRHATVGGTLSQNSVFFGSARYGTVAESVLGLTVVLADGTTVRTGAWGCLDGTPFARYFGPDLTGLFLSDSGAFGIKAQAGLALVPTPQMTVAASFAFDHRDDAVKTMYEMARLRIATDLFTFDRYYHGLLAGLGFSFVADEAYTLHCVVEGVDDRHAASGLAHLVQVARRGGREIDPSVPFALRADPFGATQAMFKAEEPGVHLPLHALVPFSRAGAVIAVFERFLEEHEDVLSAQEIKTWTLMTVAGKDFVLEPALFFKGDYRDPSVNPAARQAALTLRRELASRFDEVGAIHMQLGKYYDFATRLDAGTWSALTRVKAALDPSGAMAPGSLGLG